jgi:ion channel-forming bestrophin family protein
MVQTWLEVAASYLRSPIVGRLWGILILLILYALTVCLLEPEGQWTDIKSNFHVLQGTILGLLLVFRTNTAYDRWWEGRKLWGQLVNDLRNLALKVRHCVDAPAEDKRLFGALLVRFAYALKHHLRWNPATGEEPPHVPLQIAGQVFDRLNAWEREGRLTQILIFDAHSRALMDICGACERIKKTPIPRSYLVFIRLCITFYLLTLPWGLVEDYHFWAVAATAIIGYFMVGIELIAEDVEQPFGRGGDKLALADICRGIERSVRETLGEPGV